MKRFNRGSQRLKKHLRCGGTNTEHIGLADDEYGLVYLGWCCDCLTTFNYKLSVDTVKDKEERI